MDQPSTDSQSKPAPIESVPVLPYSVIDGQLDHSDPVWLGRIGAAVIVFLIALSVALIDDTWQALRQHTKVDSAGSTYYFTVMLQGSRVLLFTAGCALMSSREYRSSAREARPLSNTAIPWLAFAAAVLQFAPYQLAGYVSWLNNGKVWAAVLCASAVGMVVAGVLAGLILLQVARRIPNLVLARQVLASISLMAAMTGAVVLVGLLPAVTGLPISLQMNAPLAKIMSVATLAVQLFVGYTLVCLLRAINYAAIAARHHSMRPHD